MARAKNKAELIKSANDNFDKMFGLINSLTEREQNATFNFGTEAGKEQHWGRDKSIRDKTPLQNSEKNPKYGGLLFANPNPFHVGSPLGRAFLTKKDTTLNQTPHNPPRIK
ncbi:MAG: ClbS/DfsB family four-helix bundle protein [Candidatus Nomurabacteria bacterium]|jgi:hypothetical protein|nr:ClbS/DfsB family four-helix bundle protein [Candidatus Nomurabacteria bacterium]